MGKRRTEMKLIENLKGRERVFGTRRKNLLKKANELSILCDIKVLLIIHEQDKLKSEIWPNDYEEAKQIIQRFKQQRATRKAFDSFASNKIRFGNNFAISDYTNMINHYSKNQLQNLIFDLDTKIAAVENLIQSKQVLTRDPKLPRTSGETGPLNKGKGMEVVLNQEPVNTQQLQSFQNCPQKNFISYPVFDRSWQMDSNANSTIQFSSNARFSLSEEYLRLTRFLTMATRSNGP
ncbi:truncated transcription factor CAULIFLOWER D-like [Hibiscus syriacus]|uniref:truncated transcription factor CAULIFLOWER D-like n=1 Tax=Hibiscus syriacus TaxID=106335 RepID=UPI001921CE3F|nr:truncated transcription factor CAULIFLOWER D-like [Hibiscus syriacus]